MKSLLIALASAIVGAIVVLSVVYLVSGRDEIGFRFTYLHDYKEVELLSYELRDGGLLVRCRNIGDQVASSPLFELSTTGADGSSESHLLMGRNDIAAGETTEQIVPLDDIETNERLALTGRNFSLTLKQASVERAIKE